MSSEWSVAASSRGEDSWIGGVDVICCLCQIHGRDWLTTGVAGETFALAGGGIVGKQGVLLVVAIDGTRGNDVVLVFVH